MIVGVIVQARMGSTRLPGKVMFPLAGEPVLIRVIERISDCKNVNKVIVATTTNSIDEPICDLLRKKGVVYYRGSEENVLARYYEAATKFKVDVVVRVTSDCPLIDPQILDQMIERFFELNKNGKCCDYLSNTIERTFSRGLDVEIFWFKNLQRAYDEAENNYEKEHVTPFIHENPEKFALANFSSSSNFSEYRLTLDEEADYKLISIIYDELYENDSKFNYESILKLLKERPELSLINSKVNQKEQ